MGRAIGLVANMFAVLVPRSAERMARVVEHGVLLFATSDGQSAAKALACQVGASRQLPLALRGHTLLLRMRCVDEARAISLRLTGRLSAADQRRLAASEAAVDGNHVAALSALGSPDDEDAPNRSVRLDLLCRSGRVADVLAVADAELVGVEVAARHRFDSLWDLGRSDDAIMAIDPVVTPELRSIDTLRRIRDGHRYRDGSDEAVLGRLRPDPVDAPDWLATLLFEFDRVDELVDLASAPAFVKSLGPAGRLYVARARYIQRDFDGATRLLEPLRATGRRWDAEKLLARIELESGISPETVERRLRSRRPGEGFDEVAYLGLHQLGRHAEAFSAFLPDVDRRRLVEVFGGRADFTGADRVEHRLVLPQGGPGDEILMAAAYPELSRRADRTEAACDPRLHRLLTRSFPDVTFHPCERRASRSSPGFCAPGRPPRANHVLHEYLDQPLDTVAGAADRVMFGRSLGTMLATLLPVEAYLVPDQTMLARQRTRVAGGVGVVWRSEFADAIRSIHYLMPDDLAPLVALSSPIVCLQHDLRPGERNALERIFGDNVVVLDDLDMRDDFDTMAAVIANLDLVVGIGTTIVELAGALGTPTVTIYPNCIGAWRRRGVDGDQWHRSMRTAIAPDLQRRVGAVEEAVEIIRSNG